MNNKEIDAAARGCKKYLNKVRIKSFASLKELKIIVNCFINNNFEQAKETKLYKAHGGEYCESLSYFFCYFEE